MIIYSEIDIKVSPSGDMTLGANKDFELANPSGVLKQDIAFRLRTDYNDFTPHPDIGADLNSLIGEPNTRETASNGELRIINSLTKDGRVAASDLLVKAVPISLYNLVYYVFVRDGMAVLNMTPDFSVDLNRGIISY
jgi:hypothetical protein